MSDVTQILNAIEQGDPLAAEQLLPLVYDELRRLAKSKLACEKPGHTLQATALVHEAYRRKITASFTVCANVGKTTAIPVEPARTPAKRDHGRPRFRWLTPAKLDWSMSFQRGLVF